MSEPFLERLSRFSPDAGSLDRDALLFATGRASARPNHGWITLATLLAGTQVLSLVLLWPHATLPGAAGTINIATAPAAPPRESVPAEAESHPGLWSARYSLLESDSEAQPDTGSFVDSGPPLRTLGLPRESMVN